MFTTFQANFGVMLANYYKHNNLPFPLQTYMDALNRIAPGNTPCCVQMSHALNAAGITIPKEGQHGRRNGGNPTIAGGNGNYVLAVDELEFFLTDRFGTTQVFAGNNVSMGTIKINILGRTGILLFRSGGSGTYGFHTELWTGRQIIQSHSISGNMSEGSCFKQKRVMFWEVLSDADDHRLPDWLQGWWEVYDGNYYYYYFSDQPGAFYTKKKPSSPSMPPTQATPVNYATVAMGSHGPVVSWAQADLSLSGGTVETFTRMNWTSETEMNGNSNFYGQLFTRKMQ